MITKIPNVDHQRLPALAHMVETYANRYEFRLDGSSLWEGRIRPFGELYDPDTAPTQTDPSPWGDSDYWERLRRYPEFSLPDAAYQHFAGLRKVLGYFRNDQDQAILGLQDTDLFLVHHPDRDQYRWEVRRIRDANNGQLTRPRDLLTGFGFTCGYRMRLAEMGKSWS